MAGETIKTEAICLDIRPWSRTSHVVSWLTPMGKVSTVVKGAVRAKSQFLGQYDLNYTCDIVYYARAKGELHALREAVPVEMREGLRGDYRKLTLAGYFRRLVAELAPMGSDCESWFAMLSSALGRLVGWSADRMHNESVVGLFVRVELDVLRLSGLAPDFSKYDKNAEWSAFSVETGAFGSGEGRCIRVSREVEEYLACMAGAGRPRPPGCHGNLSVSRKNSQVPLDAARVIGVFYQFHLDCASDVRRTVLGMISYSKEGNG